MIRPPNGMGAFEFVVLAGLRTAQLTRGCRPRVDGAHSRTVIARREIAEGKVIALPNAGPLDAPGLVPATPPTIAQR